MYIFLRHHAVARTICTLRRARIAAACIVVAAVVVCIPTYIMYQPRQLSATGSGADTASAAATHNNSSFGFARGGNYDVEIPWNFSVSVFVGSGVDGSGQQLNGGGGGGATGGSGYWFETKSFVGPTFQTVNFWVYGVALKTAPCILLTALSALRRGSISTWLAASSTR